MPNEIEIKFLDPDLERTRNILTRLGAECGGVHFECNAVFDTADFSLSGREKLLRLRSQEWPDRRQYTLTFKAPAKDASTCGRFKVREELETVIGDGEIMADILLKLGFRQIASYEKVREAWKLHMPVENSAAPAQACVSVDLDILPFCHVIEIEGQPGQIDRAASLLALDKLQTSTKSYHYMHKKWRQEQGLEPALSFVFDSAQRLALRRRLGLGG